MRRKPHVLLGTPDLYVKRKLPRVSSSLVIPVPESKSALHQGRIRTTPHRDGQFAAFVYIPVALNGNAKLRELLKKAVFAARAVAPHLECDWLAAENPELHISLTRPIYLRDYQREELKRAVKVAGRGHSWYVLDQEFLERYYFSFNNPLNAVSRLRYRISPHLIMTNVRERF